MASDVSWMIADSAIVGVASGIISTNVDDAYNVGGC